MSTRFPLRGALSGAAVAAVLLAVSAVPSGAQDQAPTGDPSVYTTGLDGSDPDTSTTPPPPDTLPPGLGDVTGDLGCWSDGDGSDCPTAETLRLLGCFEGAVQGNVAGCTIGGGDTAPVDPGPTECEYVRPAPGVDGYLVCPEGTAGLVDLPTGTCGYLSDLWCDNGGGGTPVEMLETELYGCYALETEIPLSEWVSPGNAVAFRGSAGLLPATVNPRAQCIRDVAGRLSTLQSPQGWFNSETVPRTSAGFPLSVYHMYSQAGGLTELHRPFVGMVLSLVWQAGQVALKVSMWAFDWAVSGNVTEILTGIPAELAALLQDRVVHGLRLYEMGLALLAAVVAWKVVRARLADAAGTLVFALLAFSLGWFLLTTTAFEGYYKGAQETRELLAEGLTLGAIEEAGPGGLDAAAAMTVVLDSTVHTPWEHLNFGQELNNSCAVEAAQAILVDGIRSQAAADLDLLRACPASTDPEYAGPPGSVFVGGDAVADFASNPSGERLFGAFIVVAGQIAVAVLVMAAAMLALLSEVLLAAAFASLPLAVAGVLWPGGRRVAGAWCSLLLRGLVGFGGRDAVPVLGDDRASGCRRPHPGPRAPGTVPRLFFGGLRGCQAAQGVPESRGAVLRHVGWQSVGGVQPTGQPRSRPRAGRSGRRAGRRASRFVPQPDADGHQGGDDGPEGCVGGGPTRDGDGCCWAVGRCPSKEGLPGPGRPQPRDVDVRWPGPADEGGAARR